MTLTKNTSKGLKIQSIRQAKLPYKLIALINLLIFMTIPLLYTTILN